MDINQSTPSAQSNAHWLAEQALEWSGVPFVNLRPSIFMEVSCFRYFQLSSSYEWKATTLKEYVSKGNREQHTADHLAYLAKLIQKATLEVSPNVEVLTGSAGMHYEEWVTQ